MTACKTEQGTQPFDILIPERLSRRPDSVSHAKQQGTYSQSAQSQNSNELVLLLLDLFEVVKSPHPQ